MAFSTKQKLNDGKFIQESGNVLTLSGDTVINAATGDITFSEHKIFDDPQQVVDKQYVDEQIIIQVTGNSIYTLGSPAAVQVGGVDVGHVLTGLTSNEILQDILYPDLCGTLTNPSSTTVLTGMGSIYEIGDELTFNVTSSLSKGSIDPQYYSATEFRSGDPTIYCFTGAQIGNTYSCTLLSVAKTVTDHVVVAGSNTWGSCVCVSEGPQPKTNKDTNFSSPYLTSMTNPTSDSLTGILPYFWGTSVSVPVPGSALLSTDKCVCSSDGEIRMDFGTNTGEYLWFAIPAASTEKLGYYQSSSNLGNIGGESNLFGSPSDVSVDSPTSCWTTESYSFYVGNWATDVTAGQTWCMTLDPKQ